MRGEWEGGGLGAPAPYNHETPLDKDVENREGRRRRKKREK